MSSRVLLLILLATSVVHARGIVLESYTGDHPADATRLLTPILEELAGKGFDAGDGVARAFESKHSRAAASSGLPADFAAQVDRGFKAWVAGKFDEAIKVLVPLVANAHANTGAFAKDPSLREPMLKALIALALAQQRIGDETEMRSTFNEILRAFPDTQLARATYGPDAQQAFEQVRRETLASPRGKLSIKVSDEAGIVFIDEAYRASGSTTAELLPGEYRVLVMLNKEPSRNHRVTVRANAETTIEIDAKFDQAVRTVGFTGLMFATQADRDAHEAAFASQFARVTNADKLAIVGIDQVRGRPAVVGALVSLQTGRELRRASIPIEPDPSTDRLHALARFLAGDDPEPGLDVQVAGAEKTAESGARDEHATPRWGGWRWLTGGVAIGALATGAVLVGLDGRCPSTPPPGQQCNDVYATGTPGYIALAGGAVMAGISIYLFATHEKSRAPYVAPTQGGAVAGIELHW